MKVFLLFKTARYLSSYPHLIGGIYSALELAQKEGRKLDKSWIAWVEEHDVDDPGHFTLWSIHPPEDKECTS